MWFYLYNLIIYFVDVLKLYAQFAQFDGFILFHGLYGLFYVVLSDLNDPCFVSAF